VDVKRDVVISMDEKSCLIYKINEHGLMDSAQPQQEILTEAQVDVIGYALSEIRHQLRTEYKAAHGHIEKQLNEEVAKLSAESGSCVPSCRSCALLTKARRRRAMQQRNDAQVLNELLVGLSLWDRIAALIVSVIERDPRAAHAVSALIATATVMGRQLSPVQRETLAFLMHKAAEELSAKLN
jgi:hypothetical protein